MGYTDTVKEAEVVEYAVIPANTIHAAKLLDVTPQVINWNDKSTGEPKTATLLKWKWVITEGEYTGKNVYGTCDARLDDHPKNKWRNWSETLLGREIPRGMPLDTDDVLGLSANVSIKHRANKKDPDKVYVEVDEVLPAGDDGWSFDDAPPF